MYGKDNRDNCDDFSSSGTEIAAGLPQTSEIRNSFPLAVYQFLHEAGIVRPAARKDREAAGIRVHRHLPALGNGSINKLEERPKMRDGILVAVFFAHVVPGQSMTAQKSNAVNYVSPPNYEAYFVKVYELNIGDTGRLVWETTGGIANALCDHR